MVNRWPTLNSFLKKKIFVFERFFFSFRQGFANSLSLAAVGLIILT
jgi:hypothetical protein